MNSRVLRWRPKSAAAQLQRQLHTLDPRILEVYDFGELAGSFFVSLEYFEGQTLAEILNQDKRLDPRRAARYGAEICSQLRTLHSFVSDVNGRMTAVVHGDIKPSNIQIGARDELKLLDFGIAKMITATHNLTRHNLGSPSYCSPERLNNSQVDVHSDLWALGVTLFETLSGSPPYQAQDTRRLENLIQSRRPPRALPDNIPTPLPGDYRQSTGWRYQSSVSFGAGIRDGSARLSRSAAARRQHAKSFLGSECHASKKRCRRRSPRLKSHQTHLATRASGGSKLATA